MPRCRIAMVLLACLAWGLSKPVLACDHGATIQSEAAPDAQAAPHLQAAPVAQAAPQLPMNKCSGKCPGSCCCQGGVTSCSTGNAPGQASSGFELRRVARGTPPGSGGEQTVPYREPMFGLDRPPKA
jgi:hypothetical protein